MNERTPASQPLAEQHLEDLSTHLSESFSRLSKKYNTKDPALLPEEETDVHRAYKAYEGWMSEIDKDAEAVGTKLAIEEANYKKTVFHVDSGFTDPLYVSNVIDWLLQDEDKVRHAGLNELADRITAKIGELARYIRE